MSEHTQDKVAADPQKKADPQHTAGDTGGVQALKKLLTHGNKPPPEEVAKLFARYTYDQTAMMHVLQQRAGIAYAHEVVEAVKFAAELKEAKDPVADRTKHDVTADMKKGIVGDTRTATHVQDDGPDGKTIKTNVAAATAGKIGPNGEYGIAGNGSRATEYEVGEGTSVKNTTGGGAQITQAGVGANVKKEKEVVMGGQTRAVGGDANANLGFDGNFDADATLSSSKGDSKGGTTNSGTGGYSTEGGGSLGGQHVVKQTVGHNPDGTPIQTSQNVGGKIHVGGETSGASLNSGSTNANGTTSSANAGVDFGEGGVSAHAGYSIMTKDGSGVTASVGHGTKVVAKPPEFNMKTAEWEVAYVRTTTNSASAGGSLGKGGFGVGLGGGASEAHFDSGVRTFKNPIEAYAFQAHAAEELGEPLVDPGTALGAMSIPVGETIGSGTSSAVSANGSISFEGATIGGGGSSSQSHEMDIKRVDAQHVQVTVLVAGQDEKHIGISGNGLSDTKSQTDNTNKAITYQFDLLNPASLAAYEKFCKDRLPPDKSLGAWVRTERTESSQGKDDIAFTGGILDQNWTGTTSHDRIDDADGSHEKYDGNRANDVTTGRIGHFLGDSNSHASANLEANVENGKEKSYTATIEVGGESGSRNRDALNQWFAMGDAKGTDATHSGDWKLTADVSVEAVHKLEHDVHDFNGKTPEQKQRILSDMVAKEGGVNIHDGKPLDWDVELKGDANFPGREGRVKLEHQLADCTARLKDPNNAAGVLTEVDKTVDELEHRHAAINDRAKYTDLPGELRQKVLDQVERQLEQFRYLKSQAQSEAIKHGNGGHGSPDPKADAAIVAAQEKISHLDQLNLHGTKALLYSAKYPIHGHYQAVAEAKHAVLEAIDTSEALGKRQAELDASIAEARDAYLKTADRPGVAAKLLSLTNDKASLLESMLTVLTTGGSALKPYTRVETVAYYKDFWALVDGEAGTGGGDDES